MSDELTDLTTVARDLRAIVEMHDDLEDQAVHKATERDMPAQRTCSVEGCDKKHLSRGLCGMHYWRLTTNGTTDDLRPTAEQRFWAKVNKTSTCWLWTGRLDEDGYGKFTLSRRNRMAHRVAYEWIKGAIPENLTLDHICRVRNCVNPDHLEPVTGRVNTLRGINIVAINARKTSCHLGHELTPENTYIRPGSTDRQCRECRNAASVRYRARRKAET